MDDSWFKKYSVYHQKMNTKTSTQNENRRIIKRKRRTIYRTCICNGRNFVNWMWGKCLRSIWKKTKADGLELMLHCEQEKRRIAYLTLIEQKWVLTEMKQRNGAEVFPEVNYAGREKKNWICTFFKPAFPWNFCRLISEESFKQHFCRGFAESAKDTCTWR